eukprot:12401390-Karenia_brevis.AAC.1
MEHNPAMGWLLEHPEDLGDTKTGSPASIWQLQRVRDLQLKGSLIYSGVMHQCHFGAPTSKPT